MPNRVPWGPSTYLSLMLILSMLGAFLAELFQDGSANVSIAGIAAGLTAALGVWRSWQATRMSDVGLAMLDDDAIDELPDMPTDTIPE